VAQRLGLPVPRTVVCRSVEQVQAALGPRVALRPLTPPAAGAEADGAGRRVLYASDLDLAWISDDDLARAPVVAQERLEPVARHRVVVVDERCWVNAAADASADGNGDGSGAPDPVRWRAVPPPPDLAAGAIALARACGVRLCVQEWITDRRDRWFAGLNPAGNWLFLPCGAEVSAEIAHWLGCRDG
jgi:hypothetical protein